MRFQRTQRLKLNVALILFALIVLKIGGLSVRTHALIARKSSIRFYIIVLQRLFPTRSSSRKRISTNVLNAPTPSSTAKTHTFAKCAMMWQCMRSVWTVHNSVNPLLAVAAWKC